jgi:hypothetical protein
MGEAPICSLRSRCLPLLALSLRSKGGDDQMPHRTIRKPTRWTADEWAEVEQAARERGVPPLRYVREAALGRPSAPRPSRRRSTLVRQLARVLNNLRQLERIAEMDGEEVAAFRIAVTASAVDRAARAAYDSPRRSSEAMDRLLADVEVAGGQLNELAHRANSAEALPGDSVLFPVIARVHALALRVQAP